ncbi:MAG: BatD family protein [Limisphaerales bacterium]
MERLQGKSFLRLRARKLNLLPVAVGFCLILLWFAVPPARAASFTASLDRDTIAIGEQATLSLTFEGGQSKNVPTPSVPGLQITQIGTSQSVNIVNGATSSTVTVAFSVMARQAGEFTIPTLTADVNGQQLSTLPLKLTVLKANAPSAATVNSGSEVAFMRLLLPQKTVYAGQSLTAQLEIFLRDDVQNYGQPQFTGTPADGFMLGKNASGGRFQTQVGNRTYTVIPITLALTAVKSGTLTLGPFTANMVVVLPSQNQGGDSFLQRFFNQGEQKQVALASEQINVQSLPLPVENAPSNFNGAIGEYTMAVTAGPTNIAVGDPITVHIQISGRGDLNSLALPGQSAWHDFKIYPPASKVVTTDPLGLQGVKTFEEIVAPQNTDVHELPPFSFSYFDPDTGNYRMLTEPSVALAVHSAGTIPMPTIAAAKTENPPVPEDILPIKEEMGALAQAGPPLVTRPAFLTFQSLPVLAWLAAFVWRKRMDNLANNPRLRRRRAVAQLVSGGLSDLSRFAAENKSNEFFAMLFRLLQEQLGERLDCPASAITEADADRRLILLGASPATLESLRELFQLCNQARYAPMRGSSELNSVVAQFENVISELKNLKT